MTIDSGRTYDCVTSVIENADKYERYRGYGYLFGYPEDHVLALEIDSAVYFNALDILDNYRNIRNLYLNADSTVNATQLLYDSKLNHK